MSAPGGRGRGPRGRLFSNMAAKLRGITCEGWTSSQISTPRSSVSCSLGWLGFFFFFLTFQGLFEGNCVLFASMVLHSPAEDNSREHVEGGAGDSVDKRGPGLLSACAKG